MTEQQARKLKLKNDIHNILIGVEADFIIGYINKRIVEYRRGDITATEFIKLIKEIK